MDSQLHYKLVSFFDSVAEFRFGLPVAIDNIQGISIEGDENKYLKIEFINSMEKDVHAVCDSIFVGPIGIGDCETTPFNTIRPWISVKLYTRLFLDGFDPDVIMYSPINGIEPSGIEPSHPVIIAGTTIGTTTSEFLEIKFLIEGEPIEYIDPAILIRVFAVFSEEYYELLKMAFATDNDTRFGLNNFIEAYDTAEGRWKQFISMALKQEETVFKETNLEVPDEIMNRLYAPPPPPHLNANKRTILNNFETHIIEDNNFFMSYMIEDMENVHLCIFRADKYDFDLIDLRKVTEFTNLAKTNEHYKVIINGPYFSLYDCGMQSIFERARNYITAIYYNDKGLTNSNYKLRNINAVILSDCFGDDTRYYFIQKSDGSFEFNQGSLLDISTDFAVGVDNLSFIITNNGVASDGADFNSFAERLISSGMPFFGWLEKNNKQYFFVLMREDVYIRWSSYTATFENLIQFMIQLGARDVIWTDGDDSVGLIIDKVALINPGFKKDGPMPFAIGFRRKNP